MSGLRELTRLGSAFMLGIAVSIWAFPIIAGPRMQELRVQRDQARTEVEALRDQIKSLREAEEKRKGPVVKGARVMVRAGEERRVEVEAQRRLAKQLAAYVGKQIDDLSYITIISELQGELMAIDGVLYRLEIRALVIGSEIVLDGRLTPVNPKS